MAFHHIKYHTKAHDITNKMRAYISFHSLEINHVGISIQNEESFRSFPLAHSTACLGTSASVQRGANVFTQFPGDEAREEEPETM